MFRAELFLENRHQVMIYRGPMAVPPFMLFGVRMPTLIALPLIT